MSAPYAKALMPVVAMDGRAFVPNGKARQFCGSAPDAFPPLNCDGPAQLAILQLVQREILLQRRSRALRLSQSKAASDFEADLRRLTHSILKEGMRK